ncbi:MAG: hypothetical protein AAF415_12240 [Pseudomonadota bacterium]
MTLPDPGVGCVLRAISLLFKWLEGDKLTEQTRKFSDKDRD